MFPKARLCGKSRRLGQDVKQELLLLTLVGRCFPQNNLLRSTCWTAKATFSEIFYRAQRPVTLGVESLRSWLSWGKSRTQVGHFTAFQPHDILSINSANYSFLIHLRKRRCRKSHFIRVSIEFACHFCNSGERHPRKGRPPVFDCHYKKWSSSLMLTCFFYSA